MSEIQDLPSSAQQRLELSREVLQFHLRGRSNQADPSIDARLAVLQATLNSDWITSSKTSRLISIGAGFGDLLAEHLLLEWVWVEDELGTSTALNWPGTTILCFPLAMILNRFNDGELIDLKALFKATCDDILDLAFNQDTL